MHSQYRPTKELASWREDSSEKQQCSVSFSAEEVGNKEHVEEGVGNKTCSQKFLGVASSLMFEPQCDALTNQGSEATRLEWGTGVHVGDL